MNSQIRTHILYNIKISQNGSENRRKLFDNLGNCQNNNRSQTRDYSTYQGTVEDPTFRV